MRKILADSRKIFIRLVWINFAVDLLSIPVWVALISLQTTISTATSTINNLMAIVDASTTAVLFGIAVFGIIKKHKWGIYLAIATAIGQSVASYYMFRLNGITVIEVVWSVLIIFFAYRAIQLPQTTNPV